MYIYHQAGNGQMNCDHFSQESRDQILKFEGSFAETSSNAYIKRRKFDEFTTQMK